MALSWLVSCSDDSITPEINVENSAENFFEKSMDFSSDGGQKVLIFTTNVDWTLTVSQTQSGSTWCSVSQESGSAGTYSVPIIVTKNDGYDDRNVVIILKAGDLERNVIVNQKQKDAITLTTDRFEVSNSGGNIEIEVKSNIDYTIEIPEQYKSWISQTATTRSLSSKKLNFTIAESSEYDKREGEIIISSGNITESVKVYQSGGAIIVLSQNEYTLGSDGGAVSIDISSNFEFSVDVPNVDWISNANNTRAISSHTLVYNVSPNTSYDDREAVIVFKDTKYGKTESVTIKQKQKDAIVLSNEKIEVAQDGGVISVDINSNVSYTVEIPEQYSSWISKTSAPTSSNTRALTQSTSYFKIENNTEYEKREGEINIKYGDEIETVRIYQSGGAILVLNQSEYEVEGNASTISVELKSNIEYNIVISDSWIKEVTTRAISSSTKNFSLEENHTGGSRTGKITITTSDDTKSAVVTITQKNRPNPLSIPDSYSLLEGETYQFSSGNEENIKWESSDTSIVTVDDNGKITGIARGTATITATTQYGDYTSTCKVTVKDITDYITVRCFGASVSIINDLIQYGSKLYCMFLNGSKFDVTLVSMQLVDGSTGKEGNEMNVNEVVDASRGLTYTVTIGLLGIHKPVTCKFKFTYNNKIYTASAVYE